MEPDHEIVKGLEPSRENPVAVLLRGRSVMARPVFDDELQSFQGSSLLGSLCFGLACLAAGSWVNYSTALQTSGLTMTPDVHATYVTMVFACKLLTIFFGAFAAGAHIRAWLQIRAIKNTSESVFEWSNDCQAYVRVKGNPSLPG